VNNIQVRRARTTSRLNRTTSKKNWHVRQTVAEGTAVRVFIYSQWRWAMVNADRIANGKPIATFGLRGFHIEYL